MRDQPIILDVSRRQDDPSTKQEIDFEQAKANGAAGVFIRAVLDSRKDTNFYDAWRDAELAGLPRGSYGYYDYRYNAVNQADAYLQTLNQIKDNYYGELPLVIDVEKKQGTQLPPRANYLKGIYQYVSRLGEATEHPVLIYINRGLINYFKPIPDWMLGHGLWLAWYPRILTSILQPNPKPWDNYDFWQFSAKGDGTAYGTESKSVDINYFFGGMSQYVRYLVWVKKQTAEPEPPPSPVIPPEPSPEEKLKRLWENHPRLH